MFYRVFALTSIFILFIPEFAFANWSYITYGGYDAVVMAWQRIALIYNDNAYTTLFISIISISVLLAVFTVYYKLAIGGKGSLINSWAIPILMGSVLYLGLVVPKDNVVIYDTVKNRGSSPIWGIPEGLAMFASTINQIENLIIGIIEKPEPPLGYQQNAGGVGFDILMNIQNKVTAKYYPSDFISNIRSYIKDCFIFEMQRPGTVVTIDAVNKNSDFRALLLQANNPSVFTTKYASNDTVIGEPVTCFDAWGTLSSSLSDSATYNGSMNATCALSGFDPDPTIIPSELARCKALAGDVSAMIWGGISPTPSLQTLEMQALISNTMMEVMSSSPDGSTGLLASQGSGKAMLAIGVSANQYMPALKGVMTAIALGLVPILCLFIPTPLIGKAFSMIAGLFIWLTVWSILDALIHSFSANYASQLVLTELTDYKLGLQSIPFLPTVGTKILAVFGAARAFAMVIASVLTAVLINFGRAAVTQLSQTLQGYTLQGTAGMESAKPAIGGVFVTTSMLNVARNYGVSGMQDTMTFGDVSRVVSNNTAIRNVAANVSEIGRQSETGAKEVIKNKGLTTVADLNKIGPSGNQASEEAPGVIPKKS